LRPKGEDECAAVRAPLLEDYAAFGAIIPEESSEAFLHGEIERDSRSMLFQEANSAAFYYEALPALFLPQPAIDFTAHVPYVGWVLT